VKGALDTAALTQAAAAQGCTVAELISGVEAAQGATTAAMAAGRVSQAVGFAKSVMVGVTQLEGAGALTAEVLASGAVASGEVAAGAAAGTGVIGTVAGWLGISAGTLLVGSVLLAGAIIGGTIWYTSRSSDPTPTLTGDVHGAGDDQPAVVANVSPTATPAKVSATATPAKVSPTVAVAKVSPTVAVAKGSPTAAPTVAPTRAATLAATLAPTLAPTCAPLVKEARLCPWSPKGATAQLCGPGFCWDGGFTGTLACKQETLPANAVRIDLNNIKCSDGFVAQQNVCTGVVTACVKK
jgi:cell division septation protein DedD